MFGPKIKVSKALYEKLQQAAATMGCSSVEEYADKVLDNDASRVLMQSSQKGNAASQAEIQDLKNKLKGLGYIE